MDTETLANHIIHLGKQDFKILCSIVLHDVLELQAFCVDGKGDGGTDFISLAADGTRHKAAYQITTQKTDIINKAYNDAKKSIEKLKANHYFFLPTYNLSETEARKLEFEISSELGIPATVYSPRTMAEFLIQHKLVRKFFELTGIVDGINQSKESVDYLEMALHTYTLLSSDARNLKSQIYDDTLLYLLSNTEVSKEKMTLIDDAMALLHLSESKKRILNGRVDALIQRGIIKKTISDTLTLSPTTAEDISLRKRLYNSEQGTFYAAQVDILKAYNISWDLSDSTQSSVWIANDIIFQQISGLKSAGAVISNPFFKNVRRNGLDKLRNFFITNKKVSSQYAEDIVKRMVVMAVKHPLVVKIVRASVYISLEGTKPLAAAKSLGVNSWDEVMLLIEPTFGIPNLCSLLYKGSVNAYFDNAVSALKRARQLGIKMFIPFYYIKECAGHLLLARQYDGLELSPAEMQFSKNAFVANYYALKEQNASIPSNFIDYLATFSISIKTEHTDHQDWIRDITTDLQSLFFHMGVEYIEIPQYSSQELEEIDQLYRSYLPQNRTKPNHLIMNDVLALKCTNDRINKRNEHWILLTYDNSIIKVSSEKFNNVWINNPYYFLDMTELTSDLPDKQFCSLIHSFAQYSEQTLSIGARIIDRIVYYASEQMQQWKFKQELEEFKQDIIKNASNIDYEFIDEQADKFLKEHGVTFEEDSDSSDADIQNDSI